MPAIRTVAAASITSPSSDSTAGDDPVVASVVSRLPSLSSTPVAGVNTYVPGPSVSAGWITTPAHGSKFDAWYGHRAAQAGSGFASDVGPPSPSRLGAPVGGWKEQDASTTSVTILRMDRG
ncbi:MAG: hypothetical protein WKG01_16315 [Kofleriaceae bacterium]